MNHPPIPPKSCWFKREMTAQLHFYDTFQSPQGSIWVPFPIERYDEYMRPIIAAVAEVEWRKRAERWDKLSDVYEFDREEMNLNRISEYNNNVLRCLQIAAEWRAFGEQK